MNLGFAIEYLKQGGVVARRSWFGAKVLKAVANAAKHPSEDSLFTTTTERNRVSRWVITHDDILAEDWIAVHK